jgi:NAD+ kinase
MNIHFQASMKPAAQLAMKEFIDLYGQSNLDTATHIVAIGGDGTALKALYTALPASGTPVFAMRLAGSVGALANPFCLAGLRERLDAARTITIYPLKAEAQSVAGHISSVFGINEVVISRQRLRAAKLHVRAGDVEGWQTAIGDGVLVANPIGSAGYNQSAGGPILRWDSQLLALTGIAIRNRSEWCNMVISDRADVDVEVIDPMYRPTRLETAMEQMAGIARVIVSCCRDRPLALLFDAPLPSCRAI